MNISARLKLSIGMMYPIGIFTSYIFAILEILIRSYLIRQGWDIQRIPFITYGLVALFFVALGIIQWHKYQLWQNPVLGILFGSLCLQMPFTYVSHSEFIFASFFITLIVMILFIIINWKPLYLQERYEINSRRLFRLASERIVETTDGFTERPYPAGQASFSNDEIMGFSRFLHGKYIARPFYLEKGLCFAFSMNKSLMAKGDYKDLSHVVFSQEGKITVKISEKDYRDYIERISFDKLCESMAMIFIRFLDYYQKGLENRIITELKNAR